MFKSLDNTYRYYGADIHAMDVSCVTFPLPRGRFDLRMHLSRCPIFGVHFCGTNSGGSHIGYVVHIFQETIMTAVNPSGEFKHTTTPLTWGVVA